VKKNGNAQVANDREDYEVDVSAYQCGWHHCGNIFGLCCAFWIVLCVMLMPRCNLDLVICKFLCHCVTCANILDYVNLSLVNFIVLSRIQVKVHFNFLLPKCIAVTCKIMGLPLETAHYRNFDQY
jgi:hypothetical protein